jgi:DNA-binding MarR family transcriptional regulator
MLVRLEERGLVTRERHPTDGRARRVTLTRKGRRTYEKLWSQSEAVRERLTAAVGPRNARRMVEFLAQIVRECEI